MKKAHAIILVCFLLVFDIQGQKALSFQGKKVKDGVIFFSFNGKTLKYFTPDMIPDAKREVKESVTFSLKDDNSCNIYFKWLNPLKYKLTWKDSTYMDERDQIINNFVSLLVAQFGAPVSSLNAPVNKSLIEKSPKAAISKDSIPLEMPPDGFINFDLTLLYIQLRANQNLMFSDERKQFNEITKLLITLDKKNAVDVPKEVEDVFLELYKINDPGYLQNIVAEKEEQIKKYGIDFDEMKTLQNDIRKSLSELTLHDRLLNSYSKAVISRFVQQTETSVSVNKIITSKLTLVVEIIKSSTRDESKYPSAEGYYGIRSISFTEGKKLQTSLSISEYEYKEGTGEFVKKTEVLTTTMIFQRYDFFAISVSTGIFYSNATLKGYGVTNDPGGKFIVSEADINKNSPVTAVFLNFNFGIGSRYFSPLIQLGVDPTKKRPFLLLGGGFSIPSARIAFSGGFLWTWVQTLDKLSVGQTISSTTDLENDIKYTFDVQPRGWYLGIQYNF